MLQTRSPTSYVPTARQPASVAHHAGALLSAQAAAIGCSLLLSSPLSFSWKNRADTHTVSGSTRCVLAIGHPFLVC